MSPSSNSDATEAAAAAWFAKRTSGQWSANDESQLTAWLDGTTAHRVAYIRLHAAWERAERLQALGAGIPPGTIPVREVWGFASKSALPLEEFPEASEAGDAAESQTRFTTRRQALAAVLAVATTLGAAWYLFTGNPTVYRTQIGGLASVPLSDGSKVTLNTDSKIHVKLETAERVVKLDQGEAFFEVAKDAHRPFVVEMGDKRVTAVGTKFVVRRDHDEIRVLVTEGRVLIESLGMLNRSVATPVEAGETAQTRENSVLVDRPEPAQIERVLSWRTGYISFHNTSLADAVSDFNRYNTRKINIDDPTLDTIRIGGRFRSNDADAFLWLLQTGFPIKVAQLSDRVSLTRR
jgi:transmembrane sensor